MKILKIIGIVLIAIVAVAVVIGLVTPKDYNLSREIVIKTSPGVVFNTISHFSEFPKWSPWQELDPNMKTSIDGADGTVGAKYVWEGNDKAGSGSMQITKIEEGKSIEQALEFLKPFKSSATTYFNVEAVEGGEKVTWGMKGENGFAGRIFMTLMGGMDKAVGKDYEKGLAKLKTVCEATPAYQIQEVDWTAKKCLSVRQTVSFADMPKFFEEHYSKMFEAISKGGGKTGIPIGVYYKYDEQAMNADLAAAIPYEGKTVLAKGYSELILPASKAYLIDYYGDYMKMEPAYDAMDVKLKELGKSNPARVVEEYVTDPMAEPDTSKWLTKIYFFTE